MLNVLETFIGKKKIIFLFLVQFQKKVMLFVSSTFLLLINAVTLRRVRSILFNRVAILILLFSIIVWYNIWEDIYGGLFHSTFITHSFALFLCVIGAIVLQLTAYYPRRSQKSMGATGARERKYLLSF
jgi:hypothetical protein